jgi:hypothetical protein
LPRGDTEERVGDRLALGRGTFCGGGTRFRREGRSASLRTSSSESWGYFSFGASILSHLRMGAVRQGFFGVVGSRRVAAYERHGSLSARQPLSRDAEEEHRSDVDIRQRKCLGTGRRHETNGNDYSSDELEM